MFPYSQELLLEKERRSEAKELVEDCITGWLTSLFTFNLFVLLTSCVHFEWPTTLCLFCCTCIMWVGHNTGTPLEVESRKHLHLLLWEEAARDFERSEFAESLQWYNYSLSLFPANEEQDKNIAKLQVSYYRSLFFSGSALPLVPNSQFFFGH